MKKVKIEDLEEEIKEVENTEDGVVINEEEAAMANFMDDINTKSASQKDKSIDSAIEELTNDLQRTRADFENYRKQVEAQKTQAMSTAKYATVIKFLPLVDDFERALETYHDQLAPLQKSFEKTLSSLNLIKINSQPGTEFNPDFHEAISVEGEGETEVIAETLRPGYLYDGNVIRAAMVKVKHK